MNNIGVSIFVAMLFGVLAHELGSADVPGTEGFFRAPEHTWSFTFGVGVFAVVGILVLIEGIVAWRKGHYSLPVRLLGLTPFGWSSFSDKEIKKTETTDLAGIVIAAVVGYAAYKAIQRTYLFLNDIQLDTLDTEARKALERFEREALAHPEYGDRLDRADELLEDDTIASIDLAAYLAASTLEAGLKSLRAEHDIELSEEEKKGMVGLATALRREDVISQSEYRRVEKHSNIRNVVMHGGINEVEKETVRQEIAFAREFLDAHHLI